MRGGAGPNKVTFINPSWRTQLASCVIACRPSADQSGNMAEVLWKKVYEAADEDHWKLYVIGGCSFCKKN